MNQAFVGMGSNLGIREKTMLGAVSSLVRCPEIRVVAASKVYESFPVGNTDQPFFLNAVLHLEVDISARQLLDHLLQIEMEFGRVRKEKWGPRTLDLDVLLYGEEVVQEQGLKIPHPYLHERSFVLLPLCDLFPKGVHPELNLTFEDLAQKICEKIPPRPIFGISLL